VFETHTKDTPPFVSQPIHNIRLYLVGDDVSALHGIFSWSMLEVSKSVLSGEPL
jgi:hypothetical protein